MFISLSYLLCYGPSKLALGNLASQPPTLQLRGLNFPIHINVQYSVAVIEYKYGTFLYYVGSYMSTVSFLTIIPRFFTLEVSWIIFEIGKFKDQSTKLCFTNSIFYI